jgi:hypothetical protein
MSYDPARKRAEEAREQLSEMKKSFDKGEMPRNEQLEHFLNEGNTVLESSKEKVVDPEGKKIVEDTQKIIGSVKEFLETKNQDEILQRIGEKAAKILVEAKRDTSLGRTALTKEEKLRARQLLTDLRGALRIMLTSSYFRRTILDLVSLLAQIGKNLATEYKEEEKYPENLRMEPWEKMEDSIDTVTSKLDKSKLDSLEDRIHRLLQESARNTNLKNFFNHFFSLTRYLRDHLKAFDETNTQKSTIERYLNELLIEIKTFMGQFTSVENLDNIGKSARTLTELTRNDETLKALGQEWREYLDLTLRNPDLAVRDENKEQLRKLVQKTRFTLKEKKVSEPFNLFIQSFSNMVNDIQKDPLRVKLEEEIRSLFRDLFYDRTGHISINSRALTQLRTVIIPSIIEQLKFIPLPKIESATPSQEYSIRDVLLCVPDVVPEKIRFETHLDTEMETKHMMFTQSHNEIRITLSEIEIHVRSARVHYKRHSFPKFQDDMIVNTDVYGPNTMITIFLAVDLVEEEGRTWAKFQTGEVDAKIDQLKIKAIEGKHDTLVNVATTLLNPIIKRQIEKNMVSRIRDTMDRTCALLNDTSMQLSRKVFTQPEVIRERERTSAA